MPPAPPAGRPLAARPVAGPRRAAASAPRTVPLRALAAAAPLMLAGCVLDLTGLSDGLTGGGGAGGGAAGDGAGGCSPLACGACEAPCPEGGCPPVVLAAGPGEAAAPLGLAVVPGALYWVNEDAATVMRLLDDGSPPSPIAAGADGPRAVAAGAGLVVWSARDGVWACPPDDCDAQKKQLAPSIASGSAREVAYDGTQVYWTDRGPTEGGQGGEVRRCDPADCQPEVVAGSQWSPSDLLLVGGLLFWTAQADGNMNGNIYEKAPGSPDDPTTFVGGADRPTGLAASDLQVYWTEYGAAGAVRSCEKSTGYCGSVEDAVPSLGPLAYPRDVAVAGGRVYFSTTGVDGAIRSCPLPGCGAADPPRVHAAGRPSLHRMVVGETCVFFTDESGGGAVVKVAR